jgi:cytoskeletal protein CcmA (bactofilin family)
MALSARRNRHPNWGGAWQTYNFSPHDFIGEQAVIVGSIAANKVAVPGRVNGAILGDSVVLHFTARVEGDISSRSLSIEQALSLMAARAKSLIPPKSPRSWSRRRHRSARAFNPKRRRIDGVVRSRAHRRSPMKSWAASANGMSADGP